MTIAELIAELGRYPNDAPVPVYLHAEMFPDGVDLDGLPGEYRIGKIERASTSDGYGLYIGVEE